MSVLENFYIFEKRGCQFFYFSRPWHLLKDNQTRLCNLVSNQTCRVWTTFLTLKKVDQSQLTICTYYKPREKPERQLVKFLHLKRKNKTDGLSIKLVYIGSSRFKQFLTVIILFFSSWHSFWQFWCFNQTWRLKNNTFIT